MNFSGSGLSMTLGPRGASVNVGGRGTYLNAGIPGTGLYTRTKLSNGSARTRSTYSAQHVAAAPATVQSSVSIWIEDDGKVTYKDENGQLVNDRVVAAVKKQRGPELRALIEKRAKEIRDQVQALAQIYWSTPDPRIKPTFAIAPFEESEPQLPEVPKLGFFDRLFPWRQHAIESRYSSALAKGLADQEEWVRRKAHFAGQQLRRKIFVENDIYQRVTAMESFLEDHLQAIKWPRETNVAFEIQNDGARVLLDVDLPEIDQMPNRTASAAIRGYQVIVKELGHAQVLQLYMNHVHGIGFRLIGETFATLPLCSEVVLSAYSQRPNPTTGQIQNDYLYSVRVGRPNWEHINFGGLSNIDVVQALAQFELRRDMTPKGMFRAITPLS